MTRLRILADLVCALFMFGLLAFAIHQDRQLQQSHQRENEMFVLANRLDAALALQENLTWQWRSGTISCLARVKEYRHLFEATVNPLIAPEQVTTWRPLDSALPAVPR